MRPFRMQRVFGGRRGVAETEPQVEADGSAVGQEARCAGPNPERPVLPHPAAPIQVAQTGFGPNLRAIAADLQPSFSGDAVDLAVVVEAVAADRDDDHRGFVLRRQAQVDFGCQRLAGEIRPHDRKMPAFGRDPESQPHLAVIVAAFPLGAVARERDTAARRDGQGFLVIPAGSEVQRVDECLPGVAQIGQGDGEETVGGGDAVVVPAFHPEALQEAQRGRVEAGGLQVAVEQRLAGPAGGSSAGLGRREGVRGR